MWPSKTAGKCTSKADKTAVQNALLNFQIEVTQRRIDLQEILEGLVVRHLELLDIS